MAYMRQVKNKRPILNPLTKTDTQSKPFVLICHLLHLNDYDYAEENGDSRKHRSQRLQNHSLQTAG